MFFGLDSDSDSVYPLFRIRLRKKTKPDPHMTITNRIPENVVSRKKEKVIQFSACICMRSMMN